MERIEPPRKLGERQRKSTTMGVYVETRVKLRGLGKKWRTPDVEALRYLVDLGAAGYVNPPAPDAPVTIDYTIPSVPDGIEAQAVEFVRSIWPSFAPGSLQEAEARIVELIRLAGCEARASWIKEENE